MFDLLLTHKAEVRRLARDGTGEPYTGKGSIACRLNLPRSFGQAPGIPEATVFNTYTLYFRPDANIDISDLVSQVSDNSGNVLARRLKVTHIRKVTGLDGRVHHLEVRADAQEM